MLMRTSNKAGRVFDRKLTATMVEDFRRDPILAAKVLFAWNIPAHQQIRLMQMWTKRLTIDDSGFSMGKTATLALVIALRSVLWSSRISGVISGTFRQSRNIFGYLDKWYAESAFFRTCTLHERGQKKITHGSDVWEWRGTNNSLVRALPPGFTADSTKIRGERWHDGYFDEWTIFDIDTLTKTLFGRVTAVNLYDEVYLDHDPSHKGHVSQNHIHLSSTPNFESHQSYRVVKSIKDEIDTGNKKYVIFTSNWRHVQKIRKWRGFVDYETIHVMQKTNPVAIVGCEIEGLWQKDALSYYESGMIEAARNMLNDVLMSRKQTGDTYLGGFDSARGGTTEDTQQSGKTDDFAFSVLRRSSPVAPPRHCLTVRGNNMRAPAMAAVVHMLDMAFGFKRIVYDPGGGGAFVVDALREPFTEIGGTRQQVDPIVPHNDYRTPEARRILVPFKRGDDLMNKAFEMKDARSDSILVNKMHDKATTLISEPGAVFLAPQWDGWPILHGYTEANNMRKWLNVNGPTMGKRDRAKAESDLAVTQLVSVDIERRKNGMPVVDSYGMYKFGSRYKKDAAYSLLYAFCAYFIDEHENKRKSKSNRNTPAFASAVY